MITDAQSPHSYAVDTVKEAWKQWTHQQRKVWLQFHNLPVDEFNRRFGFLSVQVREVLMEEYLDNAKKDFE